MKHPLRVSGLALAMLLSLGLATLGPAAAPAAAAVVTQAEATAAARHGVEWMTLLQEPSGELASFGGDWSMISLASVGINAADVRLAPGEPSAQDFYLSLWTGEPPALFSATDFERAILAGYSGGLEPSRLDAQTNLLADLAAQFNGHELGEKGATNADVFGVLALSAVRAPREVIDTLVRTVREQQNANGGWNFAAGTKDSEADLTGAALAALCTAGAPSTDPAIVKAESYLHTVQDTATGGFINPKVNTDSTAWVVSGFDACKIDPQAAAWTTSESKTPIDFLIAQQNEDGSFQIHAHDEEEDFYSTQDAVRALSGTGFIAPPPAREEASSSGGATGTRRGRRHPCPDDARDRQRRAYHGRQLDPHVQGHRPGGSHRRSDAHGRERNVPALLLPLRHLAPRRADNAGQRRQRRTREDSMGGEQRRRQR